MTGTGNFPWWQSWWSGTSSTKYFLKIYKPKYD